VAVAYEAGPTGFGLARALPAAGVGCVVVAPSKPASQAATLAHSRPLG
jgi:transposase